MNTLTNDRMDRQMYSQIDGKTKNIYSEKGFKYSRLSLSRSQRDPLKHFEISVLRHIRCAELRKIPTEQPNFTNELVI